MRYLTLMVAVGLGALWIISLATGAAVAWFTWLVFIAACLLFIAAFVDMGAVRRHTGEGTHGM